MRGFSVIDWIAFILVIVGGINWGTIGFFNYNIVTSLLGGIAIAPKIVFIVVGVAAIYLALMAIKRK